MNVQARLIPPLRDGLPQRDAYDLVYRHGLDVDPTGTRVAMGSTTRADARQRRSAADLRRPVL
jgi:hypothetical protein